MRKNRLAGMFAVCAVLMSGVYVDAQTPKIEKGIHWQSVPTHGFEMASQAPVHSAKYVKKEYRYQRTGKVSDFFKEMGRPDKFSRQSILSEDHTPVDPATDPLFGVFKYEYKDGSSVYLETGRMEWVEFVVLYKKGKNPQLLYK